MVRKGGFLVKSSRNNAILFAKILEEKKAKDTIILDIKKISIIADYFIISTTQSTTHCKTLINTINKKVKEYNIKKKLEL